MSDDTILRKDIMERAIRWNYHRWVDCYDYRDGANRVFCEILGIDLKGLIRAVNERHDALEALGRGQDYEELPAPGPGAPEFAVSDELQPEWKKDWPECHCFHDVCCGLLNPKENAKCRKCKWSKPESAPGPGVSDSNGGGA